MKAIIYEKFGAPKVLRLRETVTPTPNEDEVLVKIYAFAVAKEDPATRSTPGFNGIFKPRKPILGEYLAGAVESVGKDVVGFNKGDKVYADMGMKYGSYAEYICVNQSGGLAIMPENLSFEQAAAIPNGYLTALPFLRERAYVQSGNKVLVNGASGAVGSAAVQLAKYFGAEVTGVCSTSNVQLVKSLGADNVIDYTKDDFTKNQELYDIIFDTVGKSSFAKCKDSLSENGIYLSTIPTPSVMIRKLLSKTKGKRVGFGAMGLRKPQVKANDLKLLTRMIEEGNLKAVIDRIYTMEQIQDAHIYVKEGHKKGNVIVKTKHES